MDKRPVWYLFWVLVFGTVAAACQGVEPKVAKSAWVMLAAIVAEPGDNPQPGPSPTPAPDSDICENCNGRGRLGDGTVSTICPVCDGTGKKKKNKYEGQRKLVIYHSKTCGPCQLLMPLVPDLRRVGWDVQTVLTNSGPVPRTDVYVDGKVASIFGYSTRQNYLNELKIKATQLRDIR